MLKPCGTPSAGRPFSHVSGKCRESYQAEHAGVLEVQWAPGSGASQALSQLCVAQGAGLNATIQREPTVLSDTDTNAVIRYLRLFRCTLKPQSPKADEHSHGVHMVWTWDLSYTLW